MSEQRSDVYTTITDQIIAAIEAGAGGWRLPWAKRGPTTLPRRHNGQRYRGINVVLLWMAALQRGFAAPTWMTYRQANELGGQVRKGERGSLVVYADTYTKRVAGETGGEAEQCIRFLKGYTVFNVEQIDGLPPEFCPAEIVANREPVEVFAEAEALFERTGATIVHGGNDAFYSPGLDEIHLPAVESFRDGESYVAVKAHEFIHWTGHSTRLARGLDGRFGDEAYAFEELVAELGAAFLCAVLGVTVEPRPDHAQYLAHWLEVLKSDKRAIVSAAAHAQRAVEFLEG